MTDGINKWAASARPVRWILSETQALPGRVVDGRLRFGLGFPDLVTRWARAASDLLRSVRAFGQD